MSKFSTIVEKKQFQREVLQGNHCFALGVIHAGYHAADGYPGTPSTEVIEALLEVPGQINAGWSVNEAVAVGVATGQAIAGRDAVVTMKVPGVFQAGDVIASASFTKTTTGALVLYVATDHEPSSTQYIIDSRELFASYKIPIIEPRDHQDLYDSAARAADISREFHTPVVVLVSAILAHSRGTITPGKIRHIEPQPPFDGVDGVALPSFARQTYDQANLQRIPALQEWADESFCITQRKGDEQWGIICSGEAALIVRETLNNKGLKPQVLELGFTYPLPVKRINNFMETVQGPCYIIEDGERFVEKQIRLLGHTVIGKEKHQTITNWTPDSLLEYLHDYDRCTLDDAPLKELYPAVKRPASICPGCPYRPISLILEKMKKQKRIDLIFGDIGCSTLLCNLNAFDLNFSMGASESLRQGYVLSRPESAGRVVSIIGDSSECHSGMDATRNAIFRGIGGVKIILDNSAVAMTGGQETPTTNEHTPFSFVEALTGEGAEAIEVDSYNTKGVEAALVEALEKASSGVMSTLILKAPCLFAVKKVDRKTEPLFVDHESCINCGQCLICSGIDRIDPHKPQINENCNRCGIGAELCVSRCPVNAILPTDKAPFLEKKIHSLELPILEYKSSPIVKSDQKTVRIGIRGVGGQGTLFMSKLLSEVMKEEDPRATIVAGEVHGMAQKGGSVCSTFGYGALASPLFGKASVDILIAMELGEVLRPGFLDLLKPGGIIILNNYTLIPHSLQREAYPSLEKILKELHGYNRILVTEQEGNLVSNSTLLGLLSTLGKFATVPTQKWSIKLQELSPNERIAHRNSRDFLRGVHALKQGRAQYIKAFSDLRFPQKRNKVLS